MSSKKGIRIGSYRITPLGIVTLFVLLVIIVALVIFSVSNPFESVPDAQQTAANVQPVPEATLAPEALTDSTAETPAPTPTPAPTSTPAPRRATIRALGEIAIETDLLVSAFDKESNTFDFMPMFSEIADVVGNADYTIADVEGTMGDTQSVSGNGATMYTPSILLQNLKEIGVDMLTLANDHALDGGFGELQATVKNVAAAGLDYVGAAASAEEKATPVIKDLNGIKVGFIAYTDALRELNSDTDPEAIQYGVNLAQASDLMNDIKLARDGGAEILVAIMSWGEMLNSTPTELQQQMAMMLSSAGVDVIIGYNPHLTQPMGWLEIPKQDGSGTQRTLCLLSAGNFLSNQRNQYTDSGIIFEFTLAEQEDGTVAVVDPVYIPTYVMRLDNGDNTYEYRTLAVGQWKDGDYESAPQGMTYVDFERMKTVWAEMQTILGSEVAEIAAE